MKINIADIRKVPGAREEIDFEGPLRLPDLHFDGAVRLHLHVMNATTRIIVKGKVDGVVRVACSRCAEAFGFPLVFSLDEEFLPSSSSELNPKEEHPWSDVNVYDDESVYIELDEVLRQDTISALPIQPLCREDCRGLCPICGENRNQHACSCCDDAPDPRWRAMLDIQGRRDGSPLL